MLTTDLIRIAAAGGGLHIDCRNKLTIDLIRIASAVANSNVGHGMLVLENTETMLTIDKIRIASAGKGCVYFSDLV